MSVVSQSNNFISHKICAIADCDNRTDKQPGLCYHEFPKEIKLCKKWETLARRADKEFFTNKFRYVCSEHFLPSDYGRSLVGRRILVPGTFPSVFKDRKNKNDTVEESPRVKRYKSYKKYSLPTKDTDSVSVKEEVKSETTDELRQLVKELEMELKGLRIEVEKLRKDISVPRFALERFSNCSEDICFYTGFPDYTTLVIFWEKIMPCASNLTRWNYVRSKAPINSSDKYPYLSNIEVKDGGGRPRSLKPIDEFFLFLIRLRLGLFEKDLSHRFNVSTSTVSDIVITWVNFLYIEMGSWPLWIDRATIKANLPPVFKGKYEDTVAIIDCTEFRCEVPKDPVKQSELYSEYKSHDTFKGLIGISPHVAVTFVSQLYCGQISDREITLKSGLCDFLKEGDKLMADKGFDIQDILAEKGVVLFIPPKRKPGQVQLSKEEVFETQRIARVHIHVERAIRRVKSWHIFDQVIHLTLYGSVNQIWSICCMLVNFQNPSLTC